jgi:II/X family phage/plasmid replication protein
MIDTVKLRSPYLSIEAAGLVERQLLHRLAYRDGAEKPEYEITSDELEGSWDNRISIRLMREEMAFVEAAPNGRPIFAPLACPPYVVVEGSVHKALVGHNITSGPSSFVSVALWFVNLVAADLLNVMLPHGSEWTVERVDVTECYRLPYEAIEEFIISLNGAQYPRRQPHRYGSTAIFFPGTTTAAKVYHKGPEFAKHDNKRLRGFLPVTEVSDLQKLANGIMRVEISIKAKKLKADFGEKPLVCKVTDAYLEQVHDREVARFLREGQRDMETVRTAVEVSRRLNKLYGSSLASTLYGVWTQMATVGELEVRKALARRTFYRQRRQLVDAGCSWAGTDIIIRETLIPIGFMLSRQSPFRDQSEDPRITEQLARWRQAV